MIDLKIGEVYTASRAKSGESAKGPWQFVAIKEVGKNGKEGRKEIVIWVGNNPVSIEGGGKFRIVKIHSVRFASRKDNAGNWQDEVNVDADITPVMGITEAAINGVDVQASLPFDELDDAGELPF